MRILAISGSLRAESANTQVVEALRLLASDGVEVVVYRGLNDLPHFNLDLEGDAPPEPVRELRREIGLASALVICSPEYAHGVAGVMKNALDWLVPSVEFPEMRVALINASPGSVHAQAHMRESLTMMSAHLVERACIALPLQGRRLRADEIADDPELSSALIGVMAALRAESGAAG